MRSVSIVVHLKAPRPGGAGQDGKKGGIRAVYTRYFTLGPFQPFLFLRGDIKTKNIETGTEWLWFAEALNQHL